MKNRVHTVLALLIVLGLGLAACAPKNPVAPTRAGIQPSLPPTLTPFRPDAPTATLENTATPGATATLERPAVYVLPAAPQELRTALEALPGIQLVQDIAASEVALVAGNGANDTAPLASYRQVYALVAPFQTLTDGVSQADLRAAWQGRPPADFAGAPLMLAPETLAGLSDAWGAPAEGAAQVVEAAGLLAAAWARQPAWAIVPFEALEPRWKVLAVDGVSPLSRDFDPAAYALTIPYTLVARAGAHIPDALAASLALLPQSNRDPSKMTVLVMTGVTALVRATAYRMELNGNLYPGQDIAATLRDADLTHISNEIAFFEDCPPPEPRSASLFFCSAPKYIELLDDVGTDIVELTGNHMMDYGTEALPQTIAMYDERGWKYYGGGIDLAHSKQPALIEHHGNRLAFIGCNPSGPDFAWATGEHSGAAPCEDYAWLKDEVARLRAEGYLPVVTFQYFENYSTSTSAEMRADFKAVADSGPVIVNGSQAHVPKGFEFYNGAFIHYGLGNLFFDQMEVSIGDILIPETRYEFMDRHVFYAGRHISVELLTNMLEDYARPRPMSAPERRSFLEQIFAASYW